jgi:hypothetical protein
MILVKPVAGGHDECIGSEFPMPTTRTTDWRKCAGRIACMIVLATLLAGCDKCGDWWWSPMRGEAQSCKDQVPKPPQ